MERTVLILEEHPETLELLRRVLDKEGYRTILATDGEKGLEYARRFLPELVLMERLLTKLNGLQVCRKLKEGEATKNIPVIFLTILDSENDIIDGLNAGADDYIKKPFSPDELLARIARVLSRCRTPEEGPGIETESKGAYDLAVYKKNTLKKIEGNLAPFCTKLFEGVDVISERLKKARIRMHRYTDNPVFYCEQIGACIKSSDMLTGQKLLQKEMETIAQLQSFLTRARKNLAIVLPFIVTAFRIEKDLTDERPGAFLEELKRRQKDVHSLISEINRLNRKLEDVQSLLSGYLKG